jgi:hypothetical protein
MSDTELEQYVRTAPDQPGLLRAGFPFGAALSPGRVGPWLERCRRRYRLAPAPSPPPSESTHLSAPELANRGATFLASLVERSPLSSSPRMQHFSSP